METLKETTLLAWMVASEWSLVGFNCDLRVWVNSSTSYENHQRKRRYGGDSGIASMGWRARSSPEEVTYAEVSPRDCCFVLGNYYHCGGANNTDEYRTALIYTFCRGTHRQEENQFLTVDREIVKKMDYEVQNILGWKASAPFCGWHELAHPSSAFINIQYWTFNININTICSILRYWILKKKIYMSVL